MINRFSGIDLSKLLTIIGFLTLTFITVFNKHPLTFDEVLFPRNVLLMEKVGFGKEFLLEMHDQAPGPLYQFIHYPLKGITKLQPPGIRMVNLICLLAITWLTFKVGTRVDDEFQWSDSLKIILVPAIWTVTGLALTEIPAILFMMLSIYLFVQVDKYENARIRWILSVLCGVCLGLCILGRSPFLMLIFGYLSVLFFDKEKETVIRVFVVVSIGISMSLPVFVVWGGLVPPAQAITGAGGISIEHGVLGISYTAVTFLLISPGWFKLTKRQLIIFSGLFLLLLVSNLLFMKFRFGIAPLSVTMSKIISVAFVKDVYPYLVAPLFLIIAAVFSYLSILMFIENRHDKHFVFIAITAALLIATCFKITHLFASRYIAQAAPLFVLILFRSKQNAVDRRIASFANILAIGIGVMSLLTYANFTLQ